MFFLCWALGGTDDAKTNPACGRDAGVFKGGFGRCPRCSRTLRYAVFFSLLHTFCEPNAFPLLYIGPYIESLDRAEVDDGNAHTASYC